MLSAILFHSILFFSVQEYEEDGIDWTKVEFVDNQECLDLIEKVISVHFCFICFKKERDILLVCSML